MILKTGEKESVTDVDTLNGASALRASLCRRLNSPRLFAADFILTLIIINKTFIDARAMRFNEAPSYRRIAESTCPSSVDDTEVSFFSRKNRRSLRFLFPASQSNESISGTIVRRGDETVTRGIVRDSRSGTDATCSRRNNSDIPIVCLHCWNLRYLNQNRAR